MAPNAILRGCDPAFTNTALNDRLFFAMLMSRLWGAHFDDHTSTIRHKHGLAVGGDTDVFAELVLEYFEANRLHDNKVASGSFFVN